MQLGRLEFQHIAVLHRIALPSLVVHGGSLSIVELQRIALHCGIAIYYVALWNCNILCCIVELQCIMLHCGIATYYVALWNCNILCCIVEHSARRILQHCQQVKWDSSTLQQIALH